jgi:hypothetical protein
MEICIFKVKQLKSDLVPTFIVSRKHATDTEGNKRTLQKYYTNRHNGCHKALLHYHLSHYLPLEDD